MTALAIDPTTPTTLYAGTFDGVFKSIGRRRSLAICRDRTWLTPPLTPWPVDPVTPTTLYAGNTIAACSRASTAARTGVRATPAQLILIVTLAIDPVMPTILYAGTRNDGVFKSTDGGENWHAANNGLSNPQIRTLVIDPVTPTTLYVGTLGGVFKSTDGGENWNPVNQVPDSSFIWALTIDPVTPTTLYAGTGGGVFENLRAREHCGPVNTGLAESSGSCPGH